MALVKVKRGLKANLPVLANGEPGFCEDTGELYIGSQTGNKLINNSDSSGGGSSINGDQINKETLTGDKTLTKEDAKYQYLNPDSGFTYLTRRITLPTDAEIGKRFIIQNTHSATDGGAKLEIKISTYYTRTLFPDNSITVFYDGSSWVVDNEPTTITVGYNAVAYSEGIAIGMSTSGRYGGIAIGSNATCEGTSVAVGTWAKGTRDGVALGFEADTAYMGPAFCKGYYTKATRYGEEVKNIDGSSDNKHSYSTVAWCGNTSDANQKEIFLMGAGNQRLTVSGDSAFGFTIYVTALAPSDAKRWKIEGLVRRQGTSIPTLVGAPSITAIAGTASWSVGVTVDPTAGALRLGVVGEANTAIKWVARGELEEVKI